MRLIMTRAGGDLTLSRRLDRRRSSTLCAHGSDPTRRGPALAADRAQAVRSVGRFGPRGSRTRWALERIEWNLADGDSARAMLADIQAPMATVLQDFGLTELVCCVGGCVSGRRGGDRGRDR
ncbi:MAG: hypothetical protein WCG47_08715 [Dermatophilaceae bacterium]